MGKSLDRRVSPEFVFRIIGLGLFIYLFFGFMLLPCLNTLMSIFNTTNAAGERDPLAVIRFFFAGNMSKYVWNSLKLALCLVVTVNVVGVSIVLLTEYFDIKGARILRLGYMTTLIYSGVALVTGYLFLYAPDGILTDALVNAFPGMNKNWFTGFRAVLFTMTFACTSNHALFLRNAIRGIDYNTVEAARNMGAKPFKVLWKVVFPTLIPTMFSLTVMTFITGLCAMSAPTLLGYDSINPEIVRLAGSSVADEAFPQARAALLSIILAMFTIILLTVLSAYERKGHYLSVSKTKAKLQKQKITNPIANVLAHVYAYVLFIIYMIPVVMIIIFSFQTYSAIRMKKLDFSQWTLINYFGKEDYMYLTNRGKYKLREGSISGLFANDATLGGIKLSFVLSSDNLYLALKEVALPIMEKRTAEFGCAMNLMVRDGVNCYILQQSKVNDLFDFVPRLYAPLPIYACACGKILMSELPIAVADDIIQSCNMVKFTPNTLSDPETFWQEIRTVAKQGYAVDDRELSRNGSCIAVPVRNHEGTIIAGISFSGFVDVSDVSELHTYLPALREASSEVTEKLYHCWQR